MLDLLCFQWQNLRSKGALKNETLHVVGQSLPPYVCQISSKSNICQHKKGWRGKKWSNHKAQTSRDSRPTLLPITKSWVKWNVEIWDFTCSLVSYLHSVCAKIHPNWTIFRVKGLAQKKVVKPKRSIVTSCLTYSASNDKISGQRELKKLKLGM